MYSSKKTSCHQGLKIVLLENIHAQVLIQLKLCCKTIFLNDSLFFRLITILTILNLSLYKKIKIYIPKLLIII